ncbi:MAG: tyrosine-type recombinase/integrase [Chloroflexi bacterium]|nr:tyrosine-type recombinase/integrase [Chloroflexota bacterium]
MTQSLGFAVQDFLEHKRAIGRKYQSEERELRLLVRFAEAHGVSGLAQLTPALIEDFLASRPRSRPRSFNHLLHLLGVIGCLLDWALTQQRLETSPLHARRRRTTAGRIPFLFDPAQVRRLLQAAAALPDNPRARGRGPTYRAVFALCHGLGLRAGEACGLRLGDIDVDRHLLVVRGGKFGKSRLVPHGPRVGELLGEQIERCRNRGAAPDAQTPLFSFDERSCIHPGTASQTFHQLVVALGLGVPEGISPTRLHDLRHSFAVGCLLRWYREGLDPSTRLHQLSTFMGHVSPASTAVYLTISRALLDEASRRFEAFAAQVWVEAAR